MRPIKSPHSRSWLVITGKRINKGRRLANKAARWMERNEEAFFSIYEAMKNIQAAGNDFYIQRWLDDDLWAGVSRYLVLFDETLDGAPITLRDSDIDCYGLLPVTYLDLTHKESNYEHE